MGGADKALIRLGGQSLLTHTANRFEPQVERLAVSARAPHPGFEALFDAVAMGPLSGVLAGLDWAAALGADAIATVPVDAPFLPGDLVARLCLAAGGIGVALAYSGGRPHPTCALWPTALLPDLRAFLASGVKARVLDFATAHGAHRADFAEDAAFLNLNTPQDLARAEDMLRGIP